MINRIFRKTAFIQILCMISALLANIIDSIVTGRFLGEAAVAATGLVAPLSLFIIAFSKTCAGGTNIFCGQKLGRGETRKASEIATFGIIFAVLCAIVVMALFFVFATPICKLFGADGAMLDSTRQYLYGMIIGTPGLFLTLAVIPIVQVDGDMYIVLLSLFSMCVLDVVFDLLNVMVFEGGLFGMGLASGLSQICSGIALLMHFVLKRGSLRFAFPKSIKLSFIKSLVLQGLPMGSQQLFMTLSVAWINNILLIFSNEENVTIIAAFSIANVVFNVCLCVGNGVGVTTVLFSGVERAEMNRKSLCEIKKVSNKIGLFINAAVVVLCIVFARDIAGLFVEEGTKCLEVAASGIQIMVISIIPSGIVINHLSYAQGIGKLFYAQVLSILVFFIIRVLMIIVACWQFGVEYMWFGFIAAECINCLIVFVVNSIKSKKFAFSLEDYLLLPKKRDDEKMQTELITKKIQSFESAVDFSVEVCKLCEKNGFNELKKMMAGLFAEEMACNVVRHGINGKVKYSLEGMAKCENDSLVIRFRDDCKQFSPVEYAKEIPEGDVTKNIGIRMVMKAAKDVNYTTTLGFNNLMIVVEK